MPSPRSSSSPAQTHDRSDADLAQQLAAQGVCFEVEGRNWLWQKTWKQATPEKVAQELTKDEPHLRARTKKQEDWIPLDSAQSLNEYHAFHVGSPAQLQDIALGQALAVTHAPGAAYLAYTQLSQPTRKNDRESALFKAFEQGKLESAPLAKPQLAEGLKKLTDQGYTFSSGTPLETYLTRDNPEITISYRNLPLASTKLDKLPESELEPLKAQAEILRSQVGPQAEQAWQLISQDKSDRPLDERVQLAVQLKGPDLPILYPAVLKHTPQEAPLETTQRELQALAQHLPAKTAVEALELGKGYDPAHWRQAIQDTRNPQLAQRALQAVEGKDYAARQKAFQQLATVSPEWAVETAEELGAQLPSRAPELARLAQSMPPKEALAAWRHCQTQNLKFEPERIQASRQLLTAAGLETEDWTHLYPALPEKPRPVLDLAGELAPFKPTLTDLSSILSLPPETYLEVSRRAARFKNAEPAIAATNLLRNEPKDRHETLEQMVEQKGWEKAKAAFAELTSASDTSPWSERVERMRVAEESWPEQPIATYHALRDAKLNQQQRQAFGELSQQLGLKKEGEWALSPNRWVNKLNIGSPLANSLELPVLSLKHLTGCRLTFTQEHDLRTDRNKALVEASTDGKSWRELKSFPGIQSAATNESLDLSAYDGQPLHLRFQVKPESWDQEGPGEALAISDLKITGQSLGQTTQVACQADLSGPGALLKQPTRLPQLAELSRAVGGARQALDLSQLAKPEDWPALGELAQQVGAPAAGQIWPRLEGKEEAQAMALVADLSEPKTPLETLMKRTRQLAGLKLSDQGLEGLRKLASEQPEWQTQGAWNSDGESWSNQLYIGASTQNELISPPLKLDRLQSPQLCFTERHDLRVDGNLADIQVAEDGPKLEWSSLSELKGTGTQDLKLDLSRFQGKTVRLRFEVKPRSWTNDGPGEALSVSNLRLEGHSPWGPVSTSLGNSGSLWDRALEGLSGVPEDKRDEALQALGELATGDARQALELWPLLLERPENLRERSEALAELATRLGPAAAASAWPLVDGDAEAELSRVHWLDIASRTVAPGATLADVELVYRQLCRQPLDESATRALEGVLANRLACTRMGLWETRLDPRHGPVWSNRLFIGAAVQNELTTPPIELANLHSARLQFAYKHDLRVDTNKAELEITADGGKTWTSLANFAGTTPTRWAQHEVDLSAYRSQTVQLRLRVIPTNWDTNGPGDAFELAGLKVLGRSSASAPERTVFQESRDSSLVAAALNAADGNSASMVALGELSAKLKNSDQALELWPCLAPAVGQPDFARRSEALLQLAEACGTKEAAAAWPLVSTTGPADLAQRSRLFTLASRLAETTNQEATDLYRQMAQIDPSALAHAEELAQNVPDWTAVGSWSRGQGSTWTDRLFIGAPLEQHLTTPPLPLGGMTDVRVEFSEKHDLRVELNTAGLEISSDGVNYTSLEQFPGMKADWSQRSVDLSAFGGRTVQLRFAVKPQQWTNDGPGEALGIRDLCLKGKLKGQEVTLDLAALQGAAVGALTAAAATEGLGMLAKLGPAQAWRVLGSLGQAQALGLLEGRDLGKCLTRVLQSLVVGESLDRAMQSMLEGDGQSLGEREDAVIVGGVRVGKRR